MVVTHSEEEWHLIRSLRNQGRPEPGGWLEHVRLGFNYRLSDVAAAMGIGQLERLDEILATRSRVAEQYNELLPDNATRERVIATFEREEIGYNRYLPSIHLQPYMRERYGFREGMCPVSEAASARTLALPFFTGLEQSAQERVAEAL